MPAFDLRPAEPSDDEAVAAVLHLGGALVAEGEGRHSGALSSDELFDHLADTTGLVAGDAE